jgi:hypothetical protein
LNKDNFNQNNYTRKESSMRSQQFVPGGFPFPPQTPGMEQPPRTAPPNFIPEGPGMEGEPFGGPSRGAQYRGGEPFRGGSRTNPREIRRCINRFTFIWLINGNSFWFYPTFVDRQFVFGFRWRRNRWEFDRINLRRIFFFRCF